MGLIKITKCGVKCNTQWSKVPSLYTQVYNLDLLPGPQVSL